MQVLANPVDNLSVVSLIFYQVLLQAKRNFLKQNVAVFCKLPSCFYWFATDPRPDSQRPGF